MGISPACRCQWNNAVSIIPSFVGLTRAWQTGTEADIYRSAFRAESLLWNMRQLITHSIGDHVRWNTHCAVPQLSCLPFLKKGGATFICVCTLWLCSDACIQLEPDELAGLAVCTLWHCCRAESDSSMMLVEWLDRNIIRACRYSCWYVSLCHMILTCCGHCTTSVLYAGLLHFFGIE